MHAADHLISPADRRVHNGRVGRRRRSSCSDVGRRARPDGRTRRVDAAELPADLTELLERSPVRRRDARCRNSTRQGQESSFRSGAASTIGRRSSSAAWLAFGLSSAVQACRHEGGSASGRRDASRCLPTRRSRCNGWSASRPTPLLAEPTDEALVAAVKSATSSWSGISPRWRREGIGAARRRLVATMPTRRRCSCTEARVRAVWRRAGADTRFTWSIEPA